MNQIDQHPQTRDRLLAVARRRFAAMGFERTTIRDVVGEAGANLGAVTYHFGSKQALYEAVLESLIGPMRARLDDALASSGAPLDRIESAVRAMFAHFEEYPEQPAIVLRQMARQGPLPPPVQGWIAYAIASLGRVVAEGQAAGAIAPGDPALLTVSIMSQPFFFAMTRRPLAESPGLGALRPDPAASADAASAFVRRGLSVSGRTS